MAAERISPTIEALFGENGPLASTVPGFVPRPQQMEMADAVARAAARRSVLLVEAGTGVGKSLAYLVPAAEIAAAGSTVIICTHTLGLQDQLLLKDVPLLRKALPNLKIRPALLKGRANYLCLQALDQFRSDLRAGMDPTYRRLVDWSQNTRTGDSAELDFSTPLWPEVAANADTCTGPKCRLYDQCFLYKARRSAQNANLLISNHAFFFAAAMMEGGEESLLPKHDMLIFDEAHHLEAVATASLSAEITARDAGFLVERVRRLKSAEAAPELIAPAADANTRLFECLKELRGEQSLGPEDPLTRQVRSIGEELATALDAIRTHLLERAGADASDGDRLSGLAAQISTLRDTVTAAAVTDKQGYVRWARRVTPPDGRTAYSVITHAPIAPGALLQEPLWGADRCVVLASATLSTSGGFDYLRQRLNVPQQAEELILGSPFNYEEAALLYVPEEMPPPERDLPDAWFEEATRQIVRLVKRLGGRTFVLCTSWRTLRRLHEEVARRVDLPLLLQGEMPSGALTDAFRRRGNAVLFGVQTFWEGIDVPGAALSCVIIDRIPFPVPDTPLLQAREKAVRDAGGEPFSQLSLPQAQLRLKQGFGRLIRTSTDRGIVCVLDTRLATMPYGRTLVRGLPPAKPARRWETVERAVAEWESEGWN